MALPDEVYLARIRGEAQLRYSGDESLRVALTETEGRLTAQISALSKKLKTTVDGREVNASAMASIVQRVQVEAGFAMAEQVTSLQAQVDENLASYEETIRVLVDSVHAEAVKTETLRARFAGNEARIGIVESTYATQTFAEAKKTEAITASAADATAKVLVESTARASADGALASSISTVSATVSGLSASVTAEATARATADGFLSGKYSLKVIAGNVVTGMNITSSTGAGSDVSEVTFQASSFKINTTTSNVAPFTVSGSTVYMANAVVSGELDIGTGYSRTRIDNAGTVLAYGQTQRVALEFNGTAAVLNSYAGGNVVATVLGSTSGGVNHTGSLYVASYVSGTLSTATTYGVGSIAHSSGTFSLPNSTITNLTVSGALTVSGSFSPTSISTSGGITSGAALTVSSGGITVTGSSVIFGGLTTTGPTICSFLQVGSNQVVGARGAAISAGPASPANESMTSGSWSGGSTVDLTVLNDHLNAVDVFINKLRQQIIDLNSRLVAHGLIS